MVLSYDQLTFVFTPSSSSTSVLSFHLLLCFFLFVSVFSFWLTPGGLAWALSKAQNRPKAAIQGPSGLPFLGMALCFTSSQTHRILSKLARCFHAEPLMAFSVGFTRFIISSKPETAKVILNSPAFADRPVKESAYALLFHRAMGFAPYGEYWRGLRRLTATHLFSPKKIASLGEMRAEIGRKMVDEILLRMKEKGEVEVRNVLHIGSLNNVMMSVFGKSYDDQFWCSEKTMSHNNDALELEYLVREGYELLSIFNWSDHFPFMGWLDLQRVRTRGKRLLERVEIFVGNIIQEHRSKRATARKSKSDDDHRHDDFVDVLLDLDEENKLDDSDMIAVLWEMIFRGTDTVAILLEWILARMILHPEIQSKAHEEIARVVGTDNRQVSDSDIPKLSYIQAIVKETLRVHPPGPLLSWARLAIHDTHVGHHFIPAGTTAMVNMWAITHDAGVWPDPEIFRPERFLLGENVAIMGSDLRLSPFGSGRRVCPGKNMGLATVQLWLAQLLQRFKWVGSDDDVDLTECLKLSMEMKKQLVCKALPRNTTV